MVALSQTSKLLGSNLRVLEIKYGQYAVREQQLLEFQCPVRIDLQHSLRLDLDDFFQV